MSLLADAQQYVQLVEMKMFVMNTVLAGYSIILSFIWLHLRYARLAFFLTFLAGVFGLLYHQLEPLTELGTVKTGKNLLERFARLLFLPLLTLQLYACHGHQDPLTVGIILGPPCVYLVGSQALGRYVLNGVLAYNSWLYLISVDATLDSSLLGLLHLLLYFVVPVNGALYLLTNVAALASANACLRNLATTKQTDYTLHRRS